MISNLEGKKKVALLLDPDKIKPENINNLLNTAIEANTDYILIGGSLTANHPDGLIKIIKEKCEIPVIVFPGSLLQLSDKADAILLLSLISGRNADLLIGNHVIAAPFLKKVDSQIISVGYILINCGTQTSVEYISQTSGIPADKIDISVATAVAGEMLGLKLIYLEGGSGADHPVPTQIVSEVKKNISIPLVVGGGLKTAKDISGAFDAGADIIVLGNGCEKNPSLLINACQIRDQYK